MSIQATMQASMEANQKMIQQQIQSVADQMQVYNRNKSVLGEGLSATAERGSTSQPRRMSTPDLEGSLSQTSYTPFPKVEFPHYDGEDTRTWIKKCNKYFQIVTTITEEQKVPLASIHLEGKAELWFQSFMEGGDLPSWDQFITALLKRFDDQDPELIVGQFNKLHQTAEMRARREKNMCYNCDEIFTVGHRCKSRQIYLMMSEEEELAYGHNTEIQDENEDDVIVDDMTVSLNALSGNTDMNTLRIKELLKENLQLAQHRVKFYARQGGTERHFAVVTYKLDLPPDSLIHPVFHVSLLKKKLGTRHSPSPQLPAINEEGRWIYKLKEHSWITTSNGIQTKQNAVAPLMR
ncbi:hypothetical protein BUALT_Bualt12G0147200 [Buddleja alternifolia]|uniref:Ty3 transposon capsid-like protein domain-containing protein n=1 Tax=Buddleja alternifolia TaxID=168488 RepID=A0AAV6WT09_9LAMI|nr:hypothetical protein BUALT_Bualt12G0147200 [Buddleja alternifolia]